MGPGIGEGYAHWIFFLRGKATGFGGFDLVVGVGLTKGGAERDRRCCCFGSLRMGYTWSLICVV